MEGLAMLAQSCLTCRFGCHIDYGYSNYTTEGTTFKCAKKLHPDGEFDEFYGEDERLKFGKDCTGFEDGLGVEMDCDMENLDELSPEQKKVWEMLES